MNPTPGTYFQTLTSEVASGWNRFWFTPSDPATLGLLRVAVGILALYLVACYTPDLDRYFGEGGLLPVELLADFQEAIGDNLQQVPPQVREGIPRQFRFSYLDYVAGSALLKVVHLAGLAVLMLFTLGVLTRVTAVASLIVFLSYLHRGPMLTSGTEPLVAMLMFYLAIGPSGAAFSLDARRARRRSSDTPGAIPISTTSVWATVALRLVQVHFTLVLAMMAISKLSSDVWWNGLGMWWLMTKAESRMVDLTGLHQAQLLINAWTYAVLLWQALMPILVWNRLARPLMLLVNVVMWLLLAPVIGNFPLAAAMIVASLAFVCPELARRLSPVPAGAMALAGRA